MELPNFLKNVINQVEEAGHEIFIVGGSVRDFLMNVEPKDWDLTTNAEPEEIMAIFPDARYENAFGTVILPIKNGDLTEHVVEITTYRSEQGYSDRRRPDQVVFEKELEKDLARRDFTINALAMKCADSKIQITEEIAPYQSRVDNFIIIDLFGGQKDIRKKIIRAVGEPIDRFKEDSLRMMRAIRFLAQLDFEIEPKTERAIVKMSGAIKFVAQERMKDELTKILKSDRPYDGIKALHKTNILQYIIPELASGEGVNQAHHHVHDVLKHNLLSLKHCPSKEWQVRLAALFHDIGKPKSMKIIDSQPTFYNHEYIGSKMVDKIMKRLKFSNDDTARVVNLVRNHMFYYNAGEVTEHSVRKLVAKAGKENLKDLIDLRIADRLGSDVKKGKPYKLRHLEYMMEKVQHDPVSVKELKINGLDLMELLKIQPSPKIGQILDVLLSEVLEEPERNNLEYLQQRSIELDKMDLEEFRLKAKALIEEKRVMDDRELKKDFKV
ncbi:CCA tRNA nucleotidyltransferase [Candidatus Parcubacteria bacterium]|nr:CCA tRNA nucleotidyltransferase [Patescibacteria group bacterium]MBU4309180.1 CCA tRNA nucleotidyltransferase [Patescibacteria group bacterium]MBU4432703.1 CCA tRNA nucleotidyltransferase [Patescibacteria group bacterium]MBU4577541.1 CCA tRNA nucleotidyltransferase [Patescibacteria group bacterium]MCG2697228.1 CCA tRNA nucleotidyltransferase [Candidatus Parcubacteria bacterium]